MGFQNAAGALKAGQPAYDPGDLLKLYLYGYLNRVRSSRRLEVECLRNLEVMWLLNGLRPSYHTIADFRKDNAAALKAANRDFVQLCRELGLFGGKLVGIDGSFFNGNASAASVRTKKQLQAELAAVERDIKRYQQELEDKHKLILTHEVTNAGNDLGQLVPMAEQAKQTLQAEELEVVADAGYFTEADIAACEQKQLVPYVPIPDKHTATSAEGRLPGSAFQYIGSKDVYSCPGGQILGPCGKLTVKNGVARQRYQSDAGHCKGCPLRPVCLPPKTPRRQIYRSEHAEAVERHRRRMDNAEEKMSQRAGICAHPFGTMKRWLGWDHFLVRGFEKVRGEMALLVHCYNFKRLLSIFGVAGFIAICKARRQDQEAAGNAHAFFALIGPLLRRMLRARMAISPGATISPRFRAWMPATRPAADMAL